MKKLACLALLAVVGALGAAPAEAVVISVAGTDAIYLAGRTDLAPVPPLGGPFPPLGRHGFVGAGFLQETFPSFVGATPGTGFQFSATGGIDYFNSLGSTLFGPDGNGASGSNLNAIGGISGYIGPQGPLVGVFLDNSVPSGGPAPTALDFTPGGLTTAFLTLNPGLGQVFYIGDGLTGTGAGSTQTFFAPAGSTRLFLGIPDGFAFTGTPGWYEDNDGGFRVTVTSVPEPGIVLLLGLGLAGASLARRRRP